MVLVDCLLLCTSRIKHGIVAIVVQHGRRSLAHPREGDEAGLAGALLPEIQPRVRGPPGPRGRRPPDAGERDKRGGGLARAFQGVEGGRWWMGWSKDIVFLTWSSIDVIIRGLLVLQEISA